MPKNIGMYNDDLSVPRKKDIDAVKSIVDTIPSVDMKVEDQILKVTITKRDEDE